MGWKLAGKDGIAAQCATLLARFGLTGDLLPLPGEHDLNFRFQGQSEALLKLHAPDNDPALLDLQIAVLDHLQRVAPDLPVSRQWRLAGQALIPCAGYQARVLSWLPGQVWAKAARNAQSAASLGRLLGRLDRALESFAHPAAARTYGWDIGQADQHNASLWAIEPAEKRVVVAGLLADFKDRIRPTLSDCPRQVIHNDANDYNVLLDEAGAVCGLLDFGDMVESWRVVELAVACAYALIGAQDPMDAILPLVSAYHAENPLREAEIEALFPLIKLRYAVSITMAAVQIRANPENAYLLISQEDVWRELQRLCAMTARLATLRLRAACGFDPVAGAGKVERWLYANAHAFAPVLDPSFLGKDAQVAPYGAMWAEDGAQGPHLGIDIHAPARSTVRAAFAGRVAFLSTSTVLLEHDAMGQTFWTLYGALSPDSVKALRLGAQISGGEGFATLSSSAHLHLQIVTDHLGLGAEMPQIATEGDWAVWRAISPDPSGVLGLPMPAAVTVPRPAAQLVAERQRRLGRSLSTAYAPDPLKIVGGEGCYLIDDQGRRWLDMVNNVAHCGHAHPRVVAAGQAQMARLNTNARYLHDGLMDYAERLTALFPAPLSVCFFVNSGSEANDLAIRLARAATGQHDLICVDHAYHGHVTSLIDVSPYKFNGKGGAGCPPHVRVAAMPDPYRGRWRYGDAGAGQGYAQSVADQVTALQKQGRGPALFLSEGILGTGGQIVPPQGYLAAAYAHVRKAGGLCLADEVQVGFGRIGSHMWAFEAQGVVPDIVTLGKPIGNGHPMAAVITTPAIANAFANGMEYFNTFGGNPVSAAIGLAVLDVIRDERLMAHCQAMGQRLMDGARELAKRHEAIGDVRGLGLFNGIELVQDRATLAPAPDLLVRVITRMKQDHQILLSSEGPLHNVLKIKPPAAFSAADCDRFLHGLDQALAAG
jgi:4-aminobutyrate aminotransferase-like enzyme/Ser/Thr protein kinase RdoA (MazF antagonist)